jgi:hypothetical protein
MCICQPLLLNLLFRHSAHLAINRTSARLISLSRLVNKCPEIVNFVVWMVQTVRREASQQEKSLVCLPPFDSLVTSKDLCIRFFYYIHPNLPICLHMTHSPFVFLRTIIERKLVIHNDFLRLAIDKQLNSVTPCIVCCFCYEHIPNSIWIFSKSAYWG